SLGIQTLPAAQKFAAWTVKLAPAGRVAGCGSEPASPVVRIEAHGNALAPVHHRPLDEAGMRLHQRAGAGGVHHARLRGRVKLAPGRAPAVEQLVPTGR